MIECEDFSESLYMISPWLCRSAMIWLCLSKQTSEITIHVLINPLIEPYGLIDFDISLAVAG